MEDPEHRPLWLCGLRRAWVSDGALDRWIDDRGVTGVVWTPGLWIPTDAAEAVVRLVESGAAPDASLLWDLAVHDLREAASTLRHVHLETDGADGYVAVWLHPDSVLGAERAVGAAREVVRDIGADNVAVAFAWSADRAGVLEAVVGAGVPVAVSQAGDADARGGVERARRAGLERRRKELEAELDTDEEADEELDDDLDVPVFLLGAEGDATEGLAPVPLATETGLLAPGRGAPPRLPAVPADEQAQAAGAVDRLAAAARVRPTDDAYGPEAFVRDVSGRLRALDRDDVVERIWGRDHTLWSEEPNEISDRLGWLDVAETMRRHVGELESFAGEVRGQGIDHVILCGMGGSSLAPETFSRTMGGPRRLTVLDTTDPDHVRSVTEGLSADRTLVIVSSKSGTTVETRAQLEHLWSRLGRGDRFVAVTDPGTPLAELASERGFRRTFENPSDIGGRYSALSYFGLVPAAACGIGVASIVDEGLASARRNAAGVVAMQHPGARLGSALGEAALEARDKLTLVLPPPIASFGDWIEQLVAESTGKDHGGIVPVVGEDLGPPSAYRDDRLFVAYVLGEGAFPDALDGLEEEGHPVVRIRIPGPQSIPGEMFRWELAVAITGEILEINPFDQPDVESTKAATRKLLEGGSAPSVERGSARELLEGLAPDMEQGSAEEPYLAIQAFLPPTEENASRLQATRMKLRDRYSVATTLGFGPRFLHSTGQLHKGGPGSGVFLQVVAEHAADLEIPGMSYTFGQLIDAQAAGDLEALREAGGEVARVTLPELEELA